MFQISKQSVVLVAAGLVAFGCVKPDRPQREDDEPGASSCGGIGGGSCPDAGGRDGAAAVFPDASIPVTGPDDASTAADASAAADASVPTGDAGRPASVCGDGRCTGDETRATCCQDCGCPAGERCNGAFCAPDPVCGDHSCNGSETEASCCQDCGCSSWTSACVQNTCSVVERCNGHPCECSEGKLDIDSATADTPQTCAWNQRSYTQYAVTYVNDGAKTYRLYSGQILTYTSPFGTQVGGTVQCCVTDPCAGNFTCPTDNGDLPCLCAPKKNWSASFDECSGQLRLCN